MKIGHNLMAANAIRNTNANSSTASKSMEKLSSGLAITTAADNAAGLAISEKMKGQIRGLDQASSNAQDGVSMVQTADGALSESTSILQRMRELANQASNDTNTASDRTAIQTETNELTAQLDNIGNTTQFNTKNLLDGSLTSGTVSQATKLLSVGTTIGATATGAAVITKDSYSFSSDMTLNVSIGGTGSTITIAKGNYDETSLASTIQSAAIAAGASADTVIAFSGHKLTAQSNSALANAATTNLTITAGAVAGASAGDTTLNDYINGGAGTGAVAAASAAATASVNIAGNLNAIEVKAGSNTLTITTGAGATGTVSVATGIYTGTQLAAAINTAISTNTQLKGNAEAAFNTTTNKLTVASTDDSSITVAGSATATDLTRITGLTTGAAANAVTDTTTALLTNLEDANKNAYGLNAGDIITVAGKVNGSAVAPQTLTITQSSTVADLTAKVAAALNLQASSVSIDPTKGTISIVGKDGTANALSGVTISATDATGSTARTMFNSDFSNMAETQIAQDKHADSSLSLQIGANQGQTMSMSINDMRAAALGLTNLDLTTKTGAANAVTAIDAAIGTVSSERSKLGAYQNRLESTINNLGTIAENLTSAQSSVTDVDMAKEMSEYSKNNILSQASQAMLAQANQQPQQVLKLLQ